MQMLLVFVVLVHVSHHASVDLYEGDWVLLPCEVPTFDLDDPTVVWSRYDLSPSTVHQRQKDGDELRDQNQVYRGRTSMSTDALETGDLSLNLTRLEPSDTGTYTCSVRSARGGGRVRDVELQVKARFPSWATVLLVLAVVVAAAAAVGLLVYFRQSFMPVYQVEVESGVTSVLLPCRTPVCLPANIRVEWTDSKNRNVHEYENGSDQPEEQHSLYRGRTEMKRNLLRPGDVGLRLKNPTDGDTGTFTCTVYNRERNILMRKLVELKVKVPQVEVESGEESVLLPGESTVHLPEDVRVEWTDIKDRKVHVYENGSDQPGEQHSYYTGRTEMERNLLRPGDVGLRLKIPTDGDTGSFTCSVYDREGNILMRKLVHLWVKVPQVEVESEEFVLLPCETTANLPEDVRVEWMDRKNRKVHVNENGSEQPGERDNLYKGRTEMNRNGLRSTDFGLILKFPTYKDRGTFTCTVYRERTILMRKQVELMVKVQCLMVVEVESEEESVLLPCETTANLPEDVRVEWMRENNDKVHVYMNGSDQPDKKYSLYRGRTEMNRDLLNTGDVGLRLKNPTDLDTGTFTCSVYDREGNILMRKQMELKVKVCEVEVEQGAASVLLPFRITGTLPEEAEVLWERYESEYMEVHKHQNGSDQLEEQNQFYRGRTEMKQNLLETGDVGLTLKDPTVRDTGTYECRIWSKVTWRQKTVRLSVKEKPQGPDEPVDGRSISSPTALTPLMDDH